MTDDLRERGLLDDVMIVMAGEFGRTAKVIVDKSSATKTAGRDHWGALRVRGRSSILHEVQQAPTKRAAFCDDSVPMACIARR